MSRLRHKLKGKHVITVYVTRQIPFYNFLYHNNIFIWCVYSAVLTVRSYLHRHLAVSFRVLCSKFLIPPFHFVFLLHVMYPLIYSDRKVSNIPICKCPSMFFSYCICYAHTGFIWAIKAKMTGAERVNLSKVQYRGDHIQAKQTCNK